MQHDCMICLLFYITTRVHNTEERFQKNCPETGSMSGTDKTVNQRSLHISWPNDMKMLCGKLVKRIRII